jgi:hypothetical protein
LTLPQRDRRQLPVRLATVVLLVATLGVVAPTIVLAQGAQIKLALLPVGQAGSYFDLTMKAGEIRTLEADVANDGEAAIAARTYAADVYTIVNGGFGGRLRDQPQTGTTGWLDYPTQVLQLGPGEGMHRSFTVAVPADTGSGEYITSLVLENEQPIVNDGAVGLNEVFRQAVAVVVSVPGPRSPGLAIGAATHTVVGGASTVKVAVENTGNVRLKPMISFTLFDPEGVQISQATLPMDTFYAETSTSVEFPLAALLLPGTYTVRLTLDDAAQSVHAAQAGIPLVVEAAPDPPADIGSDPGLIGVSQSAGGGPFGVVGILLVAGFLLAISIGWLVLRRRGHAMDTR